MIDIFANKIDLRNRYAGVFEADDDVSWFYLHDLGAAEGKRILGAVQVHRGPPNFDESDVEVRWFDDETKVGVFIKGKLGAYFDLVKGTGYPGGLP